MTMSHRRLLVAATIIGVIIIAGFVFSVPHTRDILEKQLPQEPATSTPSVAVHDAYKKGVHTITGSIEVPNPCTLVSAQASVISADSGSEAILVELTVPEDNGVCLQRETTLRFSTSIAAAAQMPIQVSVNGVSATTTDL